MSDKIIEDNLYGVKVFGDFNGEIKLTDNPNDVLKAIDLATKTGQNIYTNDIGKMENLIYETTNIDIDNTSVKLSTSLENIVNKYCNDILNEEGEEKNMEILKIYKERKAAQLLKDYEENLDKINQENPFKVIIEEAIEQIQKLSLNEYGEKIEGFVLMPTTIKNFIEKGTEIELKTKETIEKEEELTSEYEKSINELNDLIKEVEARLELTENSAEKVKVLKSYGILNKDGKINA